MIFLFTSMPSQMLMQRVCLISVTTGLAGGPNPPEMTEIFDLIIYRVRAAGPLINLD